MVLSSDPDRDAGRLHRRIDVRARQPAVESKPTVTVRPRARNLAMQQRFRSPIQ